MRNLKLIREIRGYSRQEIADELCVTYQAYARYENGERDPSIETLKKLAKIFEVDLYVLMDIKTIDTTLSLEIQKDQAKHIPIVEIVDSFPRLARENRIILEKYLTLVLSDIDIEGDVTSQVKTKIKKRVGENNIE